MSGEIRVVGWLDETEADGREECGIGGLGGWFGLQQRNTWQEYLDLWKPEAIPYVMAMRDEVVRIGLREGGDWHQTEGTPLFSDGKVASFSYRAWGDLLAAIWEGVDDLPYSYMSFYMSPGTTADEMRADMVARPHLYAGKLS